jgi:hypothetical protein
MKQLFYRLSFVAIIFIAAFIQPVKAQTVIFKEDFESGKPDSLWQTYYKNEDSILAVPSSQAPKTLSGGGNYVGYLQDVNGSYSGSAVAVAGDLELKNYSIEADVYVYVNQSLSAYSGLVVYADSSKHDFYKLRVDFDISDRINFSGLKADPNTYLPLFSKDYKGADNTGLYPTADGWHKLKIEVSNISSTETEFWNYFDGVLLSGSPIVDTTSTRNTSGKFGLYSFQQDSDGLPAYFDNIVVTSLSATGVENNNNKSLAEGFELKQNYPNPFNPSTIISYQIGSGSHVSITIYDQLGREVKSLVNKYETAGAHAVQFSANNLPSGIYLYRINAGSYSASRKMILVK